MLKYIDEHLNCVKYRSSGDAPFNIIGNDTGSSICIDISEPFLMMYFIDSGKVEISVPSAQCVYRIMESSFFILHRQTGAVLTAAREAGF